MKLTLPQLENHLNKQSLSPVYIISGEEIITKQDAIQMIRQSAEKLGFIERLRFTPDASLEWEQIYNLLQSTSLFSEKRLIEFNFFDTTPPKAASTILQDYAKQPSPDNIIVIDLAKIDDKISKSAWYKALEKIATIVTIWPTPREQLPTWIIYRAKKLQLVINLDAANILADYVEGNLVAAAQAIEKMHLLNPSKPIDSELMHKLLVDESRFSIFDFIENLISGNALRSLTILDNLNKDGIEPILVLWGITRELRILADMAEQLKRGITFDELFKKHRIFARRQLAVRQFLKKFSAEQCWQHLKAASHIDSLVKGANVGNPWDSLQLFCLRLV